MGYTLRSWIPFEQWLLNPLFDDCSRLFHPLYIYYIWAEIVIHELGLKLAVHGQ